MLMSMELQIASESMTYSRRLRELYLKAQMFARDNTTPNGMTRRTLRTARRLLRFLVNFPVDRVWTPLQIPLLAWHHRTVLPQGWSFVESCRRIQSMTIDFPAVGGYFDKYDFRAAMADPICSDNLFRLAIEFNRHNYPSRPRAAAKQLFIPTLLKWNGWLSDAYSAYESLTSKPGLESEGFAGMADIAHLRGRWQNELRSLYQQGIYIDACALFGAADENLRIHDECDWLEVADKHYRRAVELEPSNPNLLDSYAALAVEMQDYELAVELLNKALAISPRHPSAQIRLGHLRGLVGDVDELRQRYESASGSVSAVREHYHSHFAAELVTLEEACRRRNISSEVRHAPAEVNCEYHVAYDSVVKPCRTRLAFEAGRVATFDEVTDLGLGFLLLPGDKPLLVRDSKHLPYLSLRMFAPALQAYSNERAVVSLPQKLRTIDEGPVIVLPGYVNNYFHWMMEVVGTLALLENDPRLKSAKILVHDKLRSWHYECLELLGIGADRIIECPTAPIKIRNAICPMVLSRNMAVHPATVDYLRRNLARPAAEVTPGKRLFLTREGVGGRKVTNAQQVRKLLEGYGFKTVDPGKMTISAQRDFFADAEMLVAPGGAALTNQLFCPAGTKVLAMASIYSYFETFTCLASILKQRSWGLVNDGHPTPNANYLWTSFDYEIDVETLNRCVAAMIDDA